jgi:hypothetical protein
MSKKPLKPGDMSGEKALLKAEKTAEEAAKKALKASKVPVTKKLTKGDSRGPGKHHKGMYN